MNLRHGPWLTLIGTLMACENMVAPPPPPSNAPFIPGLPSASGRPGQNDGGMPDADPDAGDTPCLPDPMVDPDNLLSVTGRDIAAIDADEAFSVWNPDTCGSPTRQLALAMVSDKCTDESKQVTILIDDSTLGTAIPVGVPVSLETLSLVVIYTENTSLGATSWVSTCSGSEGTVIFQEFGFNAGDTFRINVDATLTQCGGTEAPVRVTSTTVLTLETTADEACAP